MRKKIEQFIQKQQAKYDSIEHKFEHETTHLRFQREFIMKKIWELKNHFEEELE